MSKYPKLNIALEYLEAAIEERELRQRYFAAMNLAGVAEELLGKLIRANGDVDQMTEAVNRLNVIQKVGVEQLGWKKLSEKELRKLLVRPKNSIKHMDSVASENSAELFFEVEDESKWLIQSAIRNLDILNIDYSNVVKGFVNKHAADV